jgi:MraZ protein
MFIGEYKHTLDDKNRLSLPAKFRTAFGKKIIITRGLDRCLSVYPIKEWNVFTKKMSELSFGQSDSRAFGRFILGGAVEVELDKSGRILIPDFLSSFSGINPGRVIVTGAGNRVELWDEQTWIDYAHKIGSQVDQLAEKLGAIGMV